MTSWLRGKTGALFAFLAVCALVVGGLGWATAAALGLEREQLEARHDAEQQNKLRLALWRLDSLVAPALAKEDSRPYNHFSVVYAPPVALSRDGRPAATGAVLEPSPLLNAELPDWMLLHFQVDRDVGWRSPQVLSRVLSERLQHLKIDLPLTNVTPGRAALLGELSGEIKSDTLVTLAAQRRTRPPLEDVTVMLGNNPANSLLNQAPSQMGQASQPQGQSVDSEYGVRLNRQMDQQRQVMKPGNNESTVVLDELLRGGEDWFTPSKGKPKRGEAVAVTLGPMAPIWTKGADQTDHLLFARHVQIGKKEICQGIVLDWPRLQTLLAEEARKEELFPEAQVRAVRDEAPVHSERAMAALPVELDPGRLVAEATTPGWTPLRVGLLFAWIAALVALTAVGLGGWSLLDLSERRIRFVSAVTHELRTPLTTLRLYLDMLTGGLVKDPERREEYLQTLNSEADRLNRLVGNVLDFSGLENQRPRVVKREVILGDLLQQVVMTWQERCRGADKELVLENPLEGLRFSTDAEMLQQILGNLIDNACKYSRGAADRRIWLRAAQAAPQRLCLEVEDRGPGVPPRERRSIFRAFRRGRSADTTGGVGLGLALVQRWAALLGGKIALHAPDKSMGACFRLELPINE
jgi:signal transduction histidine kinase